MGLSLILLSLAFSCSPDTEIVDISLSNQDIQLQNRLSEIGGSPDFYILPENDDFSNIPSDPRNPLNKDKVLLGQLLFHETGIGTNPKEESHKATYSCASCHHSAAGFQSGIQQGIGDGGMGFGLFGEGRTISPDYTPEMLDVQPIKSPTVLNAAYQKVMLWNGQFGATGNNIGTEANWTAGTPKETNNLGFEGVEIQAIAGLTVHRMGMNKDFCDDNGYTTLFDKAFPEIPLTDRYSLITTGLAIAAYERTLLSNQSNFQNWLKGDNNAMSIDEKKGALLFFGKGECFKCHNGPALNTESFHALGLKDLEGANVHGIIDEPTKKGRGGFTKNQADNYKFKVPQLYNLSDVQFFGHGGSLKSIRDIIEYKNKAQKENLDVPNSALSENFKPLNLTDNEIGLLTLFVEQSLSDKNLNRYIPMSLPTGLCFPVADQKSKEDLGCGN